MSEPNDQPEIEERPPERGILDLFGHRRLAGLVRDEVRFGAVFCRIDVPVADGRMVTRYESPKAIYEYRPCSEDIARAVAATLHDVEPVKPMEWSRQLPLATSSDGEDEALDENGDPTW